MVEKWEHEKPTPWANTCCPKVETKTYPHAIVYDFEAYQDTSKAVRPTSDLFYESEHVPISVSLADTLNPEPEYIVSRDPAEQEICLRAHLAADPVSAQGGLQGG